MLWFTSDLHFGHDNIIKYCHRPFANAVEMNRTIINNINERVGCNDDFLLFQHFFKQSKLVTFRITRNIRIVNHECGVLIVNKQNYLVEFEIKISKEDLKKDLTKKHQHKDNRIRQVNFIVPERLYQDCLELVDKNFGIWIVNDRNEV